MPQRYFQPLLKEVLKRHLEDGEDTKKRKETTPALNSSGKLSLVLQAKKSFKFLKHGTLFKGKRISMSIGSKNGNKRQTCSLELVASNLQKKTARTQKKGR